MEKLILRYCIGLTCGCLFCILFPKLIPLILLPLFVLATFTIIEIVGVRGFNCRWHDYRFPFYSMYGGFVVSVCLGILFGVVLGNGKVGVFLVYIGLQLQ